MREPFVKGQVGIEAKPFLKEAQAKNLPVVNLRRWSTPGNELPFVIGDASVFECVVQGAIGSYDKVFKVNRTILGHGVSSNRRLPVYKFTITVEISNSYEIENWSNALQAYAAVSIINWV